MSSTHFHDDHRMIVPRRATGYAPRAGGGFEIDMSNFEQLGDGSVMTTVEDLARWDRNFYTGQVGGAAAIETTPGTRRPIRREQDPVCHGPDPRPLPRRLRACSTRANGSGIARASFGSRSSRLSVIVLCNMIGDMDPLALSERVADVYLHLDEPSPPLAPPPTRNRLLLQEPIGMPRHSPICALSRWPQHSPSSRAIRRKVCATSDTANSGERTRALVTPFRSTAAGDLGDAHGRRFRSAGARARAAGGGSGRRICHSTPAPITATISACPGPWGSATAPWSRTQWMFPAQQLEPLLPDIFTGDLSEGGYALRFTRNGAGEVNGFAVATTMVRPRAIFALRARRGGDDRVHWRSAARRGSHCRIGVALAMPECSRASACAPPVAARRLMHAAKVIIMT